MSFTLEGNASNVVARLDSINERVSGELKNVVDTLEGELLEKIMAKTPVQSGALKASIEGKVTATRTGAIAEISANPTGGTSTGSRRAYYALFVEYGAKLPPHEIDADTKQALRFQLGGASAFAKKVQFPGGEIEAEEFMHGPFRQMRPRIEREIKAAVTEKI